VGNRPFLILCHICAVGKGPFGTTYSERLRVCNSLTILCPSPILRLYDKSGPPIPGNHPLKSEVRSLLGLHAKVLHPHLRVNQEGLFLKQSCDKSKSTNWYTLQNEKTKKYFSCKRYKK